LNREDRCCFVFPATTTGIFIKRDAYRFSDEKIVRNEPIEPDKTSIRAEPYSLPADFQWDTLNLDDPLVLSELYTLLSENYVEDDDAMFRFDYPSNFLKWALQPPGWCMEWHCGVRVSKSGRLVGFISAIPATLRVYNQ
jgi:glycylpeptide N-tetradecanoyltransferase